MFSRKFFYCLLLVNCVLMVIYYLKTRRVAEEKIVGWERRSQKLHFLKPRLRILPEDFCDLSYFLMVVVHSPPENVERRRLIRITWAEETEETVVYFLLGTSKDRAVQDEVVAESELYGDVVQGDFLDTPLNRTLKSLLMLQLTSLRCYHSRYLLKVTDADLVNLGNVVSELARTEVPDFLVGQLICRGRPERSPSREDYTPYYLYPNHFYPPYLNRGGYLMSVQVAKDLYLVVLSTPIIHLEEIYITGLCAREAGIKPRFDRRFSNLVSDECYLKKAFVIFDVDDLEKIWGLVSSRGRCEGVVREKFCHVRWLYNSVFKPSYPFSERSCV